MFWWDQITFLLLLSVFSLNLSAQASSPDLSLLLLSVRSSSHLQLLHAIVSCLRSTRTCSENPAVSLLLCVFCVCACVCVWHGTQPPCPFIMQLSVMSLLSWKFLVFLFDRGPDETHPLTFLPAHTFTQKIPPWRGQRGGCDCMFWSSWRVEVVVTFTCVRECAVGVN